MYIYIFYIKRTKISIIIETSNTFSHLFCNKFSPPKLALPFVTTIQPLIQKIAIFICIYRTKYLFLYLWIRLRM